jgi:hypothetical protein
LCLISAGGGGGGGAFAGVALEPKPAAAPTFKSGTFVAAVAGCADAVAGDGGTMVAGMPPVSVLLPNIIVFPYFFFIMGSF